MTTRHGESEVPRRFPSWWTWLFPASYVAHMAEEYWAGEGFPAWITRIGGVDLPPERFLAMNAFGLLMTLVGIGLVLRARRMEWILASMATAVLLNAVSHIVASIATESYSPGLVTGLALWGPLGVATLARARASTSPTAFGRAVAVGVAVHVVVLASLTLRAGG